MADTFTLTDLNRDLSAKGKSFQLSDIKPQPYDVNPGLASAMNIGQALSFEFGDEILDKLGLVDKERYRATVEQFRKDNPASAMLGTVSGSMLLPFGAGKAVTAFNPFATAAAVGGAQAAFTAAGEANTLEAAGPDAGKAAMAGMVAGPALLGATKTVGPSIASILKQGATRLPIVGEDLANRLALAQAARQFSRDRIDTGTLDPTRYGPDGRVFDFGGDAVNRALDVNATLPGQTGDLVDKAKRARQGGEFARLNPMIESVSGGNGRALQNFQAWQAQKEAAAGPLYRQLHQMQVTPNAELDSLLKSAADLGAFREAKKIASARQMDFSLNAPGKQQATPPTTALLTPGVAPQRQYSMADLDNVKRGIDQLVAGQMDETGKLTPLGAAYNSLRVKYLKTLDDITTGQDGTSAYKAARDAFSGPASMQTALKEGERFWNQSATELSTTMAKLSGAEQEAFRIGAAEALRKKIGGRSGRTELLNYWQDNNTQEKFKAILGSDAKYSDVIGLLDDTSHLRRLEKVGAGSQTARRLADAEDQGLNVAEDVLNAGVAMKSGAWQPLLSGMRKYSTMLGTPEPVRDAVGQLMLKQPSMQDFLAIKEMQELLKRRAATAGAASGASGGLLGAELTQTR